MMILTDEIDWLGNSCLHNLFANYEIDIYLLRKLIIDYPHLPLVPNKLGRIPLHYAVDRGKVNIAALEVLINAYPEGIALKDSENMSPYDIVKKWDHNKTIHWLLLSKMPEIDQEKYLKLKYGPLGSLAVWANASRGAKPGTDNTFDMNYEEEREEVDLFPVPEEEDDEEGEEEEEKSDRLKSRRGSAVAIPVRKGSISEVVEFDSGIINSGNADSKESRRKNSFVGMKDESSVTRNNSLSSVRSFDDTEIDA